MGEKMVVEARVREHMRSKYPSLRLDGGGFIEALSSKVESLVDEAAYRAMSNDRKTLRAIDL